MNYLQITMETALLTTQCRLRGIDSESHSLSSESRANLKAWRPEAHWHSGYHNQPGYGPGAGTQNRRAQRILESPCEDSVKFFIKIHSPGAWACRPNRGRGPRAAAEATQHNVTKPHRPLTYRGVGNAAASAGAAGPFEGLRARTEQSDGAPRTKLELLPCCQSKMSSTNQELSPCCQSNMSWAKRLLYVFIYHC